VVVDELANRGVKLIVIAPGSRSGALAIAAAGHPDIETRVVIDERSAAFHALGSALASKSPVAVLSTSGSAPAHFFPAVVEADMSGVPLIAVSADRPEEMQGVGANQTIDQTALFGTKVRDYVGIEAPDASVDRNLEWRHSVARLVSATIGARPGPAHLNVRFREPTVPVTDDGRIHGDEYPFATPRLPNMQMAVPNEAEGIDLPQLAPERGLIIAGDGEYDRQALAARAAELRWPILVTALSGLRGNSGISTYHHLLSDGVPGDLRPETVVAVGSIGPSERLETLVAAATRRVRIDRWGRVIDPKRNATEILVGDVNALLARVARGSGPSWMQRWARADEDCRARMDRIIVDADGMSGAAVAKALNEIEWGCLVVASSLPIREVDAHLTRPGPVLGNRGASGIDGFVSTALGVAAEFERTIALAGDLSLLHDSNGFLNDAAIDLTAVVIDNDGGGLFDSLPQARHAPDYERLFVTPPDRDLQILANFHGLRYQEVADTAALSRTANEALGREGIDLIRVPVDRALDVNLRNQLDG
jgi:2-succinyl-5-enolpyruvyl-6-hydroxy-3-cyclohexene-1-carboxylate synthase